MVGMITKHYCPHDINKKFNLHRDEDFFWTWKIVFNSSYLISRGSYKNKKLARTSLLRHAEKFNIEMKNIITDYSPYSKRTF